MRKQDRQRALQEIRQAVLDQRYVMTDHALLEMREDHLDLVDVESAILTGRIEQVFDDDPRGRRFEIIAAASDLHSRVGVVVRIVGLVLVITVYQITDRS